MSESKRHTERVRGLILTLYLGVKNSRDPHRAYNEAIKECDRLDRELVKRPARDELQVFVCNCGCPGCQILARNVRELLGPAPDAMEEL